MQQLQRLQLLHQTATILLQRFLDRPMVPRAPIHHQDLQSPHRWSRQPPPVFQMICTCLKWEDTRRGRSRRRWGGQRRESPERWNAKVAKVNYIYSHTHTRKREFASVSNFSLTFFYDFRTPYNPRCLFIGRIGRNFCIPYWWFEIIRTN